MGEYVVGAYLRLEEGCDFVDYNVRAPGGGLRGLHEFDVIGLNFKTDTAYLCEVATHIRGLKYGTNMESVYKVRAKHLRQREYAKEHLDNFQTVRFMFWSPVVPHGYLTDNLKEIENLELIINGRYRECVDALRARASEEAQDAGNPFFRALQILEHMRD